jgi:putative FmdB family regulatory protein
MPMYGFKCSECNEECEFILKYGETRRKCPSCGKLKLVQELFGRTSVVDTYSPMHPRRGRGRGGAGRIDPGNGAGDMGKHFN